MDVTKILHSLHYRCGTTCSHCYTQIRKEAIPCSPVHDKRTSYGSILIDFRLATSRIIILQQFMIMIKCMLTVYLCCEYSALRTCNLYHERRSENTSIFIDMISMVDLCRKYGDMS